MLLLYSTNIFLHFCGFLLHFPRISVLLLLTEIVRAAEEGAAASPAALAALALQFPQSSAVRMGKLTTKNGDMVMRNVIRTKVFHGGS